MRLGVSCTQTTWWTFSPKLLKGERRFLGLCRGYGQVLKASRPCGLSLDISAMAMEVCKLNLRSVPSFLSSLFYAKVAASWSSNFLSVDPHFVAHDNGRRLQARRQFHTSINAKGTLSLVYFIETLMGIGTILWFKLYCWKNWLAFAI